MHGLPVVRILLLASKPNITEKVYCQFWYEGHEDPITSKAVGIDLLWIWSANPGYSPYVITCENYIRKVPKFISIVEERCDHARNLLEVHHKAKMEKKKNFVVCLKDMNFRDDISRNLVEWLEILKIFGADKVAAYVIKVHPRTMNVLKFYESQGFVDLKVLEFPKITNEFNTTVQRQQKERIAFNDCFYKNYNEFNFVVPLDVDELIVPLRPKDRTWMDLMERILKKKPNANFDSYEARDVRFIHRLSEKNSPESNNLSLS